MKTYMKWVGNKSQLFPEITARFPASFGNYYEPFTGSAAVYLSLVHMESRDQFSPDRDYFLRDINKHLINSHLVVAYRLNDLIKRLENIEAREHTEPDLYNQERKLTTEDFVCGEDVIGAARVIYLNKRAYGGMWRENKSGMFNVPKCKTQDTSFISSSYISRLKMQSQLFRKADIQCGEYYDISPQKGDLVFLDPPYVPVSDTSNFTAYSKILWNQKSHDDFFDFLHKLDKDGVLFITTNNDVEYVRAKTKEYNTDEVKVKRFIDALKYKDGTSKKERKSVNELIIRNFK